MNDKTSAPVDVLAVPPPLLVLDDACETLDTLGNGSAGLREASAAVAELVEASRSLAECEEFSDAPPDTPAGRFIAALAKFGGAR